MAEKAGSTHTTSTRVEVKIRNLTCTDCAEKVERGVGALPGVDFARFELTTGRLTVDVDTGQTGPETLMQTIHKMGYEPAAIENGREAPPAEESFFAKNREEIVSAIAAIFWVVGFVAEVFEAPQYFVVGAYLLTMAFAFSVMARQVWSSATSLSLDMNLLMTGAVIGAMILGEWSEGAMVLLLFAVSEIVEERSMARTSMAIESLMNLAPEKVRMLDGINEMMVPPDQVPVGSLLVVHPGERIGLDGEVESGYSGVAQSQITGESLPVDKVPGDPVFAGSVNGDGNLTIRTTRPASESTVARIVKLVRQAQSAQAPTQKFIEKFAKVYTPLVFLSAILVTVIPVFAFGAEFTTWFYRSLVVLLVACPCAFVIATPVTIVSGLTAAAKRGLLIKGGAAVESAARLKAFAFDKTGTLTKGQPKVVDVQAEGRSIDELLSLAGAIEKRSGHILGQAISEHVQAEKIQPAKVMDIRAIPGKGAEGSFKGRKILIGRQSLFDKNASITGAMNQAAQDHEAQGRILVFIGEPDRIFGLIALSDSLRDHAATALSELRKEGIEGLVMISGDHERSARAMAAMLPLDDVLAGQLPEQKVDAIAKLRERYGPVAMVGDGINDAPALVASDFGLAMGAGSDQALESADGALITGDLTRLPVLIRIARKTAGRVKTNIAIALGLKAIFLVLAVSGLATLWMAVFADTGTSLIVIFNGLRLLREG